MKKDMVLKIRISADDRAKLDALRGKQNQSVYIRGLIRAGAAEERKETNQFLDLFKKVESITTTNSGAGRQEVREKLETIVRQNDNLFTLLALIVLYQPQLSTMREALKGAAFKKVNEAVEEIKKQDRQRGKG